MSENNGSYHNGTGRFIQGNPGKPKGAASNASALVKAAIQKFLEDNIEEVQKSFDTLKPLEKLQFITNILPYVVPKLTSIDASHSGGVNQSITVRWDKTLLPKSTIELPLQE